MSDQLCSCGLQLIGDAHGNRMVCRGCKRSRERCDCNYRARRFDPDADTLDPFIEACEHGHEDEIVFYAKTLGCPQWYVGQVMREYDRHESVDDVCLDVFSVYDKEDERYQPDVEVVSAPSQVNAVSSDAPIGAGSKVVPAPQGQTQEPVNMSQAENVTHVDENGVTWTQCPPGSAVPEVTGEKPPVMEEQARPEDDFMGCFKLYNKSAKALNAYLNEQHNAGKVTAGVFWQAALVIFLWENFGPLGYACRTLFGNPKNMKAIEARLTGGHVVPGQGNQTVHENVGSYRRNLA